MNHTIYSIKKNITFRIITFIIVISIAITVIASVLISTNNYKELNNGKLKDLELFKLSYSEVILKHTFDLDKKKLDLILEGVLNAKEISYIKITEISKNNTSLKNIIAEKGKEGNLKVEFDLYYDAYIKDYNHFLRVDAAAKLIPFNKYIINDIENSILETLLITVPLSVFIYLILYFFVIRHIVVASKFFSDFAIYSPSDKLHFSRIRYLTSSKDEIGVLENSINLMRKNMLDYAKQKEDSEAQLIKNNLEILKQKEKAEESDRLKSMFLKNISHEVRTPMNAIHGFSKLLLKTDIDRNQIEKFTKNLNVSTRKLLEIFENIITLAHIESDQITLTDIIFPANKLYEHLLNEALVKAKEQDKENIDIAIFKNAALHFNLKVDYTRLHQVLSNLIDNAIKFTNEGYVHFGFFIRNNFLEFTIEDTGIGFSSDKHALAFKAFTHVHKENENTTGGLGAGLTIVGRLVQLFKGEIIIEHGAKKGTIIKIILPKTIIQE